mgnify:CR=1 FL=1
MPGSGGYLLHLIAPTEWYDSDAANHLPESLAVSDPERAR